MGADRNVWSVLLEQLYKWAGVQPVKRQSTAFFFPWLVEIIVQPTEHLGRAFNHLQIGLRVKMAKDFICVVESVDVEHFACGVQLDKGMLQGFSSTQVSRAC